MIFFKGEAGNWSEVGCDLSIGDEIVCECDHLTNFAILVVSSYIACVYTYTLTTDNELFMLRSRMFNHGLRVNQKMILSLK